MNIVAYTFQAENVCPACIVEKMIAAGLAAPAARDMRVEDVLDQIADANCIDRYDEKSYDSGEFPKVVFSSQVESDERCDSCGESVI
jgi:hypothetical protein